MIFTEADIRNGLAAFGYKADSWGGTLFKAIMHQRDKRIEKEGDFAPDAFSREEIEEALPEFLLTQGRLEIEEFYHPDAKGIKNFAFDLVGTMYANRSKPKYIANAIYRQMDTRALYRRSADNSGWWAFGSMELLTDSFIGADEDNMELVEEV